MYVKSRVVTDAILLAKKSFSAIEKTDQFGSLQRVHPFSVGEEVYDSVQMLREIFYAIAPLKNKGVITAQNFEKLI